VKLATENGAASEQTRSMLPFGRLIVTLQFAFCACVAVPPGHWAEVKGPPVLLFTRNVKISSAQSVVVVLELLVELVDVLELVLVELLVDVVEVLLLLEVLVVDDVLVVLEVLVVFDVLVVLVLVELLVLLEVEDELDVLVDVVLVPNDDVVVVLVDVVVVPAAGQALPTPFRHNSLAPVPPAMSLY